LLIVQRNVTVFPAVNPVTVLVAFVGEVIVTPGFAPNTLHDPLPTTALLPLNVNVLVLHWKISAPAFAVVGAW